MKKTLLGVMLLGLLWVTANNSYAGEFNPDGKVGSFIWTIGGALGTGSEIDKYPLQTKSYDYGLKSYSGLLRMDHPASKTWTFIMQLEYATGKTKSVTYNEPYESSSSGFKVGIYFKFFTLK